MPKVINASSRRTYAPYVRAAGRVLAGVAKGALKSYAKRKLKSYMGKRKSTRRSTRSRKKRRTLTRTRTRSKTYKCKIDELCKFMKRQEAIHIRRQRRVSRLTANPGEATHTGYAFGGSLNEIENACSSLRYFDPATNNVVIANPGTGVYSRDINVQINRKIMCKNNCQIPVLVSVYSCIPKEDSGTGPNTFFNNGLVDQGNPSNVSPLVYFNDCRDVKHMWRFKLCGKRALQPGQSVVCKSWTNRFDYDFGSADAHSDAFQKNQGGHIWWVRLTGTLGHDSLLNNEVGSLAASLDIQLDNQYTFRYDAGKDLHDISVDDTSTSTFTNVPVQSAKPICDNQGYSIA